MTTDKSRADVLTGQHTHALMMAQTASCTCLTKTPDPHYHDAACRYRLLGEVIDFVERCSSQPTAAPIDVGVDCLEKLRALMVRLGVATNESLEGFGASLEDNLYRTIRAVNAVMDAAMAPTAPAPADERAAFEAWMQTGVLDSTPDLARDDLDNYDDWNTQRAWRGWQARAASANETGAKGAAVAWMRIDDPRDCISDAKKRDMIEHAGAPGARLAENYSIALGKIVPAQAAEPVAIPDGWKLVPVELTEEMRAAANNHDQTMFQPTWASTYRAMLEAAPQHPAQADAPAEIRDLPMMRNAFRVTEVSGDPDPAKQGFAMRFSFPSIEALHAADDEWNKFIAAAQADAREGLTSEMRDVLGGNFGALEQAEDLCRATGNDSSAEGLKALSHALHALLKGAKHD
jgi:hypothetical protein